MTIDSAAPQQFEEIDRLFGTLSEAGQVLMPLAHKPFQRIAAKDAAPAKWRRWM